MEEVLNTAAVKAKYGGVERGQMSSPLSVRL